MTEKTRRDWEDRIEDLEYADVAVKKNGAVAMRTSTSPLIKFQWVTKDPEQDVYYWSTTAEVVAEGFIPADAQMMYSKVMEERAPESSNTGRVHTEEIVNRLKALGMDMKEAIQTAILFYIWGVTREQAEIYAFTSGRGVLTVEALKDLEKQGITTNFEICQKEGK